MEQNMVLVDAVGVQPPLPHFLGVVTLDVPGLQLAQPDGPQGRNQVVSDQGTVGVVGGIGPVWGDDLFQPIVQPLLQGGAVPVAPQPPARPAAKLLQGRLRLRPVGKGTHTPIPFAVGAGAVVEADVIQPLLVVIGQILFDRFSCHVPSSCVLRFNC